MKHSVFTIFLVIFTSVFGPLFAEETMPARPVLWATASFQTSQNTQLVGLIEPRIKTDLGFQILGRLIKKNVSVGEVVTSGQLLAVVDPTPFELALRNAQSEVSNARAQLSTAIAEEARQQALFIANATPETALELAAQRLETARASETQALAVLAKAEEQLTYTRITAEHDGIVINVYPEVGEIVAPGQVILTIARLDIREAVVDLPEVIAADLAVGGGAIVALELNPQTQVTGTIREIEPAADSLSRTIRARITLIEAPNSFRLGTTVFVSFEKPERSAIILPLTAILMQNGAANVWIINDDDTSARLNRVTIGEPKDGFVEIITGVEAGDRIIVVGVNSLTTGALIRLGEEQTF